MPAPDELDRDKFYTSEADDDGEDYELEGPDPDVVAAEQRRAAEAANAYQGSIDIDEIYRDSEHSRSTEILQDWVKSLRAGFRFQVKHLLIATAILAIGLTLWQKGMLWTSLVIGTMFSIVGVYLYLQWKDRQHQNAVAARRGEMYARRRMAQHGAGTAPGLEPGLSPPPPPLPNEVDQAWQEAMERQSFRFQFSLAQLLLAMVGAAVTLGFTSILGPQNAATLLGFVALAGLVVHAAGFEPPPIVALGWWLLLVMYVLLSIFTLVRSTT